MRALTTVLRRALAAGALAVVGFGAGAARAQTSQPAPITVQGPARLPAYGRSMVTDGDATALRTNPANLARLPGSELRWSGIYLPGEAVTNLQGHAFSLAFPIPIIPLGFGVRWDIVNPPADAPLDGYQVFTWGAALRLGKSSALGVSSHQSWGDDILARDLHGWNLGYRTDVFDGLALALGVQNVDAPTNDLGVQLARSYDLGVMVRPLGSRALEVGVEGRLIDDRDATYWNPRATLAADLPFGRLRADVAVNDVGEQRFERSWVASAGLTVNLQSRNSSSEVGFGAIAGSALGDDARYQMHRNLYSEVALRGFRDPVGVELGSYAVKVTIESPPDAREHVALLRRLWAIADDPAVEAVLFQLRSSPGGVAHVEELRDAIHVLKARGKKVMCHLESAGGSHLYLCSAADRTLMTPSGAVRYYGLALRYLYFKDLLGKLGIQADFARVSDYKSAPEQLTRRGSSDRAADNKRWLLTAYERALTAGIASGRKLSVAQLRQAIRKAPFTAKEAQEAGLIDGVAYSDELKKAVNDLVGHDVTTVDLERPRESKARFGKGQRIAIVYIDGDIVDGKSRVIPFVGSRLVGSYTIQEALQKVAKDSRVGAIVLRVESPGGSVIASDIMWHAIEQTAKKKPVVVSMGAQAASGGYYVAAPATRIFANRLSLTGSIGVFNGKVDIQELLRKIGVNVEVFKTTPRADGESIFRPFTPDERKELKRKVMQYYEQFLDRVRQGRKLRGKRLEAAALGRVFTGGQAKEKGLVDEIGGLRQALAHARKLAGLPDHAPIQQLPPRPGSLLGRLIGVPGLRTLGLQEADADGAGPIQLDDVPLSPRMRGMVRDVAPILVHEPGRPLARAEIVLSEP